MAIAGSGDARLPFPQESFGDSDAFAAPDRVSVHITDFQGNPDCDLRVFDPSNRQQLDRAAARPGADTVKLDAKGTQTVYLNNEYCGAYVSASS
jgi:hypothetical protein